MRSKHPNTKTTSLFVSILAIVTHVPFLPPLAFRIVVLFVENFGVKSLLPPRFLPLKNVVVLLLCTTEDCKNDAEDDITVNTLYVCVCVCVYIYILFLSLSLSLQLACTASLESVEKCVSGKEERKMEKEHVEDLFFFEIFFLFPPRKNTPPSPCPSFLPGKTREIKQHERTMSLSLASWYVCSVGQRNISVHALVLSFSHPLFFCVARFLFDCSRACCVRACNAHHPYPIVLFALSRAREQIKHDDG